MDAKHRGIVEEILFDLPPSPGDCRAERSATGGRRAHPCAGRPALGGAPSSLVAEARWFAILAGTEHIMPSVTRLQYLALVSSTLLSCARDGPMAPCVDDLPCYLERIRQCHPAALTLNGSIDIGGTRVTAHLRSTVIGQLDARCQVVVDWLDAGPPPSVAGTGQFARTMQCLWSPDQGAEMMRKMVKGEATSADFEPCFPAGECGPVPLLATGCVLGKCLLGRWTYTCELNGAEGRPGHTVQCEGTRLSDGSPFDAGCASYCEGGHELLDCRANPRTVSPRSRR